jgi:hypothetical protein
MQGQCVRRGVLSELATMDLHSPAVIVIGAVARLELSNAAALIDAAVADLA